MRVYTHAEFMKATSNDPAHYLGDADAERISLTIARADELAEKYIQRYMQADIERLRALIAKVERVGDGYSRCPWCARHDNHESDCPAFTPDGDVK